MFIGQPDPACLLTGCETLGELPHLCCNTVCGSSKQSMIRNSNFWALEVAKISAHDLTRVPNKEEW